MSRFSLFENAMVVPASVPIDTTGAEVAGDFVNMAFAETLTCIIKQGAWAGGTPAVTMVQSDDAAGTTTAAFTDFKAKSGVALTDDQLAAVTVTSGSFNLTAVANTFTVIEALASALTDGFSYLRINIASPGANADLIDTTYILTGLKYQGENPPSVIA